MSDDIFAFWSQLAPDDRVHPRDRYVLERIEHNFDLRCLPSCFGGPLKTARVVLLYLSPGLSPQDIEEAERPEVQARYVERRKGYQPLPGPNDHARAWKWWSTRTKLFGEWQALRDKVAILNIGGYHSTNLMHKSILAALPSCRITIGWAQEVLFPEAERGDRVVICMRSAQYWGLGASGRYGKALFAPAVIRSGHMRSSDEHAVLREEALLAARAALAAD